MLLISTIVSLFLDYDTLTLRSLLRHGVKSYYFERKGKFIDSMRDYIPDIKYIVKKLFPVITSGNSVIALVPGASAVPAMTFAEVLATSDLPHGVINILTGSHDELAPWAASHMDIDGMDISGIEKKKRAALKEAGAENLKRIHHFEDSQTPNRIYAFMEAKTVWHPIGV